MTYEYICQACEHQWEAQQRISEDPLTDCPACGKSAAKRQISKGGGFILKGGGWYSDLYSSAPAKKEEGEAKGAEAKGESSSGGDSSGEKKKTEGAGSGTSQKSEGSTGSSGAAGSSESSGSKSGSTGTNG